MRSEAGSQGHAPDDPVSQNIETIAALRAQTEQEVNLHQRAVEKATGLLGRPAFLHTILGFVALWILANLYGPRIGLHRFDAPPFYWLQGLIGLGALLMTVMVLTTQNRQSRLAERRSHLDLQINLLAEQRTAKLVALFEELRRDLPIVPNRADPEAEALQQAADPQAVLSALDESLEDEIKTISEKEI